MSSINPIMKTDYPDPDVIRVGDTYYMISTTMYFMPGGVILRSYDLVNWEILNYVFDGLDGTPGQRLEGKEQIYGKGMWAASLRYHEGTFYVCFVANDTHQSYLYCAKDICGPWERREIKGFYHDCSLLFDDDGRVYIVYGNKEIWLTELDAELSGPKPGGLHRRIVTDTGNVRLGYEGSHIYKINGKYYVFFIHWPKDGKGQRTEACFVADRLDGEFRGQDVLDDDMGYWNQGVAQGGLVDTPEGQWYAVLFRDSGAVGRIPVLVSVTWQENFPLYGREGKVLETFPVFGTDGKVPEEFPVPNLRPDHQYAPLFESDDFRYGPGERLKLVWQWNHMPDPALWSVSECPGALTIRTGKVCEGLTQARNTLTQRMRYPACAAQVTVDVSDLREGDYAGLCALQSGYGMIALTREEGRLYLVMMAREAPAEGSRMDLVRTEPGQEYARIPWEGEQAELRVVADFTDMRDECACFYRDGGEWRKLGPTHKLAFTLDHFTGCRFGLFVYSTRQAGGAARFRRFVYL